MNIEVKIFLFIDVQQIRDDGGGWLFDGTDGLSVSGAYGHEQHHVRLIIEEAKSLLLDILNPQSGKNFGEGEAGKASCESHCSDLKSKDKLLTNILANQAGHQPGRPPEVDNEYPPFDHVPPPRNPLPSPFPGMR
ncbi:hypothetical protein [Novipirellula galeiformis]|uniref:hypothetical protein n=1 Tax=Novipirellula galeiformis TaxID=2528004 RepID=UPI0011B62316|nr:hypothetical protein [Novipirellula galeiformis]